MNFAVNYSQPAAALLRDARISLDRFKCPAWPDLVVAAQLAHPVYVHFPLKIGLGIGDALDTETNGPPDWGKIEALLRQTDTQYVNLHFIPRPGDYPAMPADTTESAHVDLLVENTLRDIAAVRARFGAERVIIENEGNALYGLRPVCLPRVIRRVVEESGCGFLLDLSHARLVASYLDMDEQTYISALPVGRLRELHITGIQYFDEFWVNLLRKDGAAESDIPNFAGRRMDHLPMTVSDWEMVEWALAQIRAGAWTQPWMVAYEYGGIGKPWESVTLKECLEQQVPRLYHMVHANP
jgi:uncharacterized protein